MLEYDLQLLVTPGDVLVREHLLDVFDERWKKFKKELRRCQRKLTEPSVHDLRVATRRLLSILDVADNVVPDSPLKKTRQDVKKCLKMFGPLRDVQVQILLVDNLVGRFPALEPFLTVLKLRERQLVKAIGEQIKQMRLGSLERQIAAGREHLEVLLENQTSRSAVRAALVGVVASAFTKSMSLFSSIDPDNTETIHTLRVAFKKFRYTTEVLHKLLPGISDDQLDAMHAYQQRMGDIQDIEVLAASVRLFTLRQTAVVQNTLLLVESEIAAKRQELIFLYIASANELRSFWQHGPSTLSYSAS